MLVSTYLLIVVSIQGHQQFEAPNVETTSKASRVVRQILG